MYLFHLNDSTTFIDSIIIAQLNKSDCKNHQHKLKCYPKYQMDFDNLIFIG